MTFSSGAGVPSSLSSVISSSLRRRRDEVEEVKDAADGKSIVLKPSAESVSSDATVNEKTMSCGVNVSRTD
jgi:hypothetical protein